MQENQGTGGYFAPYASFAQKSRGRLYAEEEGINRNCYQRDRDRVIHSTAFRRLEYKTQVFVNHEGDHYRTRLTHSLEVSQLARSLCRELGLDEDLAEALALTHDLGHPPFGHAGEEALAECMTDFGGFDHNAQAIRVVTQLERKYAEFDGINLTWETLEGIAKHNGPLIDKNGNGYIPRALKAYNDRHDLELHTYASAEAQAAGICDDIAYNNHDIEDGLRAGLFTLQDIINVPFVGEVFAEVSSRYPDLEKGRLIHESKRRLIHRMCSDVVMQTRSNIEAFGITDVENVRNNDVMLVHFSQKMQEYNLAIKAFLKERMYSHYKVNRMTSKGKRIVRDLFQHFIREPECLPTEWQKLTDGKQTQQTAETVTDFIAGMTDRFAFEEHQRIFDLSRRIIGYN